MSSKAIEELRAKSDKWKHMRFEPNDKVIALADAEEIVRCHFPAPQQDAGDWEKVAREMLPCSQQIKRVLTIAGVPKETVLNCGTEVHHIYCPAYYVPAVATALRSAAASASSEQERRINELGQKLAAMTAAYNATNQDLDKFLDQARSLGLQYTANPKGFYKNAKAELLETRIADLQNRLNQYAALEAGKPVIMTGPETGCRFYPTADPIGGHCAWCGRPESEHRIRQGGKENEE